MLQTPDARVAFELICRTACLSDRNNGHVLPATAMGIVLRFAKKLEYHSNID
jgi:hypothetical protein